MPRISTTIAVIGSLGLAGFSGASGTGAADASVALHPMDPMTRAHGAAQVIQPMQCDIREISDALGNSTSSSRYFP
jgi:hypothetical protein